MTSFSIHVPWAYLHCRLNHIAWIYLYMCSPRDCESLLSRILILIQFWISSISYCLGQTGIKCSLRLKCRWNAQSCLRAQFQDRDLSMVQCYWCSHLWPLRRPGPFMWETEVMLDEESANHDVRALHVFNVTHLWAQNLTWQKWWNQSVWSCWRTCQLMAPMNPCLSLGCVRTDWLDGTYIKLWWKGIFTALDI